MPHISLFWNRSLSFIRMKNEHKVTIVAWKLDIILKTKIIKYKLIPVQKNQSQFVYLITVFGCLWTGISWNVLKRRK